MLQANIDESEGEGVFVVGGYVASADQWAAFSDEWQAALDALNDGEPLHMNQARHKWRSKFSENLLVFYKVIHKYVDFGVSVAVGIENLKHVMGGLENKNFSDPYFFCFFEIVKTLLLSRHLKDRFDQVQVIFDEGREKPVLKVWDQFWNMAPPQASDRLVGKPQFLDDTKWNPLQAADLKIWLTRSQLAGKADDLSFLVGSGAAIRSINKKFGFDELEDYRDTIDALEGRPSIRVLSDSGFTGFQVRSGHSIMRFGLVPSDPEPSGSG